MPRWIFHAIPTRLELGNKTILRIGRNVNEISPITTMIILSINVKSFRTFLPELFFALDRKWRNYLTSDSSRSVTEYLRNCNTRAVPCRFRAFRVPQLPSNFIITPGNVAPPPPHVFQATWWRCVQLLLRQFEPSTERTPQPGIIYSQLSLWQRRLARTSSSSSSSSRVTDITGPWLQQR